MDQENKIMRNEKGHLMYKKIRRVFIRISIEKLHVLMAKDVDDGGYPGVRSKDNEVMLLVETLRLYKSNWLKKITKNDMNIYACEICQNADDLHSNYVVEQKKIIAKTEVCMKKSER